MVTRDPKCISRRSHPSGHLMRKEEGMMVPSGVVVTMKRKRLEEVTLDVSSSEPYGVDVSTRRPYGMILRIYQARDGYMITEVTDGSAILRKADDHSCERVGLVLGDGGSPSLLLIHARNGEGTRSSFYYEKNGGHTGHNEQSGPFWKTITETTFYSTFHSVVLRNKLVYSFTMETTAKNHPKAVYTNKSPKFPFAVYAANSACRMMRIREGQTTVWNAQSEDERCLYASFYPRESPILAYMIIHRPAGMRELFLQRIGYGPFTQWVKMGKEEYAKGLQKMGFNPSTFSNEVILDISNVDSSTFYTHIYWVHRNKTYMHTPLPGYSLVTIMDGPAAIWTATGDERCTYINIIGNKTGPLGMYIFVADAQERRKIRCFRKLNGEWNEVSKGGYRQIFADDDVTVYALELPRMDHPRIIMSSFRNRQGLRLTSYASIVDNSRGDIILIHGFRSYFMSEFGTFRDEWNLERFDYPSSPRLDGCFIHHWDHLYQPSGLVKRYAHLFDYGRLNGMNALEILPQYQYEGSLIEAMNRMGYNVYGYDHQAQGLSESISTPRCSVKSYADYVRDLLQFVSIVKRGKFYDPTEKWDEQLAYGDHTTSRKLILVGFSMGGNVAVQATQEFYKHAEKGARFIDAIIGLSPMLSVDLHLDTFGKRLMRRFAWLFSWVFKNARNPYEYLLNFGESADFIVRFMDPYHYTGRNVIRTFLSLFYATIDARRDDRMAHYPRDLPTLFIHSKGDFICGVDGPREVVKKLVERGSTEAQLVELEGTCHYLNSYQVISTIMPIISKWLEKI